MSLVSPAAGPQAAHHQAEPEHGADVRQREARWQGRADAEGEREAHTVERPRGPRAPPRTRARRVCGCLALFLLEALCAAPASSYSLPARGCELAPRSGLCVPVPQPACALRPPRLPRPPSLPPASARRTYTRVRVSTGGGSGGGGGGKGKAGGGGARTCPVTASWNWVNQVVVGLNLCPWAKGAVDEGLVNIILSQAESVDELVGEIRSELQRLAPDACRETSIILTEDLLPDFLDYLDAVAEVEALISELDLDGVLQLATFHPNYQFGGTDEDAVENWTNRSPFPAFHILQEREIEEALAAYQEPDEVWERNIRRMQDEGADRMAARLAACRQPE
eukprot:Tamp_10228.p1 GENE.Tamp_10228~~Tamp_10228.p1  ORF type:complete len:344 (-),score=54.43 Tamp_10228:1035-2045(-)